MPDRHDPKLSIRPPGERQSDDRQVEQPSDDPLVELARAAARSSSSGNPATPASAPRTPAASADRPSISQLPSESDLARDLEAELLNELQASFSMVPEVANRTPQRQQHVPPNDPPAGSTEETANDSRQAMPPQAAAPPPVPAPPVESTPAEPAAASPHARPKANVIDDEDLLNDILSDFNDDILGLAPQPPTSGAKSPPPSNPPDLPRQPVAGQPPRVQPAEEDMPTPRPETARIKPPVQEKRLSLAARIAEAAKNGDQREQPQAPANRVRAPRLPMPPQRPSATAPPVRGNERPTPDAAEFRPPSAVVNPPRADLGTRPARPVETRWELPPDPDAQSTFDPSRFAPLNAGEEDTGHPEVEPAAEDLFFETGEGQISEEAAIHDEYEAVPGYDDELLAYPDEDLSALPARRSRRGPLAIAALLAILVIGGATVMLMRSGGSSGPPPIIVADAAPTKITPETAATGSGDSQSKLIYDRVDPGSEVANSQLVVTDNETIADIPPVPEDTTSNDVSRVILGGGPGVDAEPEESGSADAGPVADGNGTTVASSTPDQAAIGPKKVRTVVVRPDGTIVSSEAVAPEEVSTPAAAEANTSADDVGETLADLPPASETPAPPGADENPLLSENFGSEEPASAAPAAAAYAPNAASSSPSTPSAPSPPTPSSQAQTGSPAVVASAGRASAPLPTTNSGASSAGRTGNFLVQISSQRSEATALQTFGELQRRYPGILGDRAPDIQRADLGERGIYYRVRVGYPTREEAVRMCENLKASGGDCLLATR